MLFSFKENPLLLQFYDFLNSTSLTYLIKTSSHTTTPNAGKHSQLMYIFYRIKPTHNLSTFSSRFESRLDEKLKESNDRVVKEEGK